MTFTTDYCILESFSSVIGQDIVKFYTVLVCAISHTEKPQKLIIFKVDFCWCKNDLLFHSNSYYYFFLNSIIPAGTPLVTFGNVFLFVQMGLYK